MSLINIKKQLDEIERLLNRSFEETIIDALKEGEEMSYYPNISSSKTELQMESVQYTLENYYKFRSYLVKEAKKLQSILDEAQSLQHTLNMLQETLILPTIKTVVERQIRKNYLDIEKEQGSYPNEMVWVYREIFAINLNCEEDVDKKSILNEGWW